jgi:hypothetical protein
MNTTHFLNTFFQQISNVGLDISGLPLDHIAYQASSSTDYEKIFPEFEKLGSLVNEEIIGGRRVAVFKLENPIQYKEYKIPALELIEPREGQVIESALQHAEFVVSNFESYLEKYLDIDWDTSSMHREEFPHLKLNFENGLTLKFLQKPILELLADN